MSKLRDPGSLASDFVVAGFDRDEVLARLLAFNMGQRPKPEARAAIGELTAALCREPQARRRAIEAIVAATDWKKEPKGGLGTFLRNAELLARLTDTTQHELKQLLNMARGRTDELVLAIARWLTDADEDAKQAARAGLDKRDPAALRYGRPTLGNQRIFALLEDPEEDPATELLRLVGGNPKGFDPAGRPIVGAHALAARLGLTLTEHGGIPPIDQRYVHFEVLLELADHLGDDVFAEVAKRSVQSLCFDDSTVLFATRSLAWDDDHEVWAGTTVTRLRRRRSLVVGWRGDWWHVYPAMMLHLSAGRGDWYDGEAQFHPRTGKASVHVHPTVEDAKAAVESKLAAIDGKRQPGGGPAPAGDHEQLSKALEVAVARRDVAYVAELLDRGARLSPELYADAIGLLDRRGDSPRIRGLLAACDSRESAPRSTAPTS